MSISERDLLFNEFLRRSFRDNADRDYVAARMLYRCRLFSQAQWSALQALEKYLKHILAFNRISAKGLGHDLRKSLIRADEKLPFDLWFDHSSRELLNHLDDVGENRYFEVSHYTIEIELQRLDHAVWQLRRYCRTSSYDFQSRGDGPPVVMLRADEQQKIELSSVRNLRGFDIPGGEVEKILADPRNPARAMLIWHNRHFGPRPRNRISHDMTEMYGANAPLSLNPEILDEVVKYVTLPTVKK